jgi:hypothetical protein
MLAVLVATMASAMDDEGFTYEEWEFHNWAAKYKWGRIMDELRADMTGVPDYHWDLIPDLFRQAAYVTTHEAPFSDEMPWNFGELFHNDEEIVGRREKLIHTLGVVGSVRFEAEPDSPYTGLF